MDSGASSPECRMNVIAVADKIFVELGHKKRGGYVAGLSDIDNDMADTGFLERGLESDDAVLRYGSGGCDAGGKHHHGTMAHIELRYLGTIEQTGSDTLGVVRN